MTRIECLGCGHVLALPPSLGEGAEFGCAHCGLVMRNVEAARAFRWASLDPYVRAHGVSRLNLWGGLGGAALWVPILAVVLAVQGRFDGLFLAALAAPYLAFLALLGRARARTPALAWQHRLWTGLGAYCVYAGALVSLVPRWRGLLSASAVGPHPGFLLSFGAIALVTGFAGAAAYRRRLRTVPRISGTPPAGAATPPARA